MSQKSAIPPLNVVAHSFRAVAVASVGTWDYGRGSTRFEDVKELIDCTLISLD
jgi:hypothetical protein